MPPPNIESTQSKWLKDAKVALLQRDPVDALVDVEILLSFAQRRLAAVFEDGHAKSDTMVRPKPLYRPK